MTALGAVRWLLVLTTLCVSLFGMRLVPRDAVYPIALTGAMVTSLTGHVTVAFYWFRYRWWKSSVGIHLMCFMAGLTSVIDLTILDSVASSLGHTLPWRHELTLFAWILLPTIFIWRFIVLLRVNHYDEDGNIKLK